MVIRMVQGQPGQDQDALKEFKNAYLQLLNGTLELAVNQPVESVKKIVDATIESQGELLSRIAKNGASLPIKDIVQTNSKLLQSYGKQIEQSKEIASKTWSILTDASIAWLKVATEAEKSAISAYEVWSRTTGL